MSVRNEPEADVRLSELQGMNTLPPAAGQASLAAQDTALSFLSGAGFGRVDTPILEDSELFALKGGGEMASLVCTLTEPGGRRLSLRPEFTSQIIRMYAESDGLDLPLRLCYAGPVFRLDTGRSGRYRQFIQVGAEIIGAGTPESDADLICTALDGLGQLGVRDASIRLGHMDTLSEIFGGFNLSASVFRFVTGSLNRLESGTETQGQVLERAKMAGLAGGGSAQEEGRGAPELALQAFRDLQSEEKSRGAVGRRSTAEILARLEGRSTQPVDLDEMESVLDFASALAGLRGSLGEIIDDVMELAMESGAGSDVLDPLKALAQALADRGVDPEAVQLHPAMAKGMAYYTGAMFDLAAPDGRTILGGGGRYDGLVATLGGSDVPALGFAYDMDAVARAAGGS